MDASIVIGLVWRFRAESSRGLLALHWMRSPSHVGLHLSMQLGKDDLGARHRSKIRREEDDLHLGGAVGALDARSRPMSRSDA